MVIIQLGYMPSKKKWIELKNTPPANKKEYIPKYHNGYLVIPIDRYIWKKVQNVMRLRKKGYDAIIIIDGKRRTGKSTLAQAIAYLLYPKLTINNFVKGLEDAPTILEETPDEGAIIFDEGSLTASSKDVMKKKNRQILKIIDVIGQKRLTLIFCLPEFFELARPIAITHSLFLIHIYTERDLTRGRFCYFGTRKKRVLYDRGKKNYGSYKSPKADFIGSFYDFKTPFETEYQKLKRASLAEAFGKKNIKISIELKKEFTMQCLQNLSKLSKKIQNTQLATLFNLSATSIGSYLRQLHEKTNK